MRAMRPEVKRWFKIIFCSLLVVFSVSIGFSDWVVPGDGKDVTTGSEKPTTTDAVPCAFIDNDETTLYTIEDALDKAGSLSGSNVVYVKPGTYPTIKRNCTISAEDTLCIPYSITKDENGNTVCEWQKIDNQASNFADYNKASVNKYRKNRITIVSGITVEVKGTLQLGGQVGSPGAALSGQTNGNYCEIVMEPKSRLLSTGNFHCFGYVKESRFIDVETEYENEALVDVSNGTIHIPFVIHDFKGGTNTVSRFKAGKQSPFEVVDIVNVQTLFRFHNPAVMKAYADLYAGDKHNTTNFDIFSSSNSLLNFSSGSYFEAKYINSGYWEYDSDKKWYESYTTSYNYGAKDDGTAAAAKQFNVHTKLSLYGNVSFGTMSMTIDPLGVGNMTISTDGVYFPVSFRQEIHIYGNLSIGYKIQLMGGCHVYIEQGATVTNSADFIGYGDDVKYTSSIDINGENYFIANPYPQFFVGKAAKIYLNGKYVQSSNGFACYVVSLSNAASLNIVNASNTALTVSECGYKTLDSTIDKGLFVLNAKTTEIERIDCKGIANVATLSDGSDVIENYTLYKGSAYLGAVDFLYYNSIDINPYFSISETNKNVNKNSKTFSVNLKVNQEKYPDNRLDISIKSCEWNIGNIPNGLSDIRKTIGSDSSNCSLEGKITSPKDFKLPIAAKVTCANGMSVTLDYTISINASCLIYDSLLLMADGTYMKAGEVVPGDMVMSYNHETGKIEPTAIIVNDDADRDASEYDVINLHFSDNSKTGIVYEHGFFDLTLNRYVYFREDNYSDYIGHYFYGINGNGDYGSKKVRLTHVDVEKKYTKVCSPVTANNLNIISDNMLSIAGGIEGLFNYFDYEEGTPKYDSVKMEADIEKYGLMTYDDYKDLMPYSVYEVLPCQYMSVSIGKGLITWDTIKEYIQHWGSQLIG